MAVAQGGSGKIEIFEDFVGAEWIIAETAASGKIGSLRLIGDGIAETDSGAVSVESGGLSGVIRLTTTNEDKHGVYIATPLMFDAALMGTLVLEARIRVEAVANREIFVGFSDVNADDLSLEDDLVHGGTATITLTASDICGFLRAVGLHRLAYRLQRWDHHRRDYIHQPGCRRRYRCRCLADTAGRGCP